METVGGEAFQCCTSTAIKWVDQKRHTGTVRPYARSGEHRSHRLEAHADEIVTLAKNSDITLAELVDHVLQTHGLTAAPSLIWRLLDRHDMTSKKIAHAAEQQRPDVLRQRQTWFHVQVDFKPERLMFDLRLKFSPDFWRIRVLVFDLMRPAFATSFWSQTRWVCEIA